MDLSYIATVLGVILVSMTLHEVMHGFVAYYLGDDTAKMQGRLTLNPVKHIDPFLTILLPILLALTPGAPIFGGAKPVPFNPARVRYGEWGSALVAVSGPLVNLIIAFLAFGVGVLSGVITSYGFEVSTLGMILQTAIVVNLGFFIFNMLPIPPLDGSRVLYALAPDGVRRFMSMIEQFGIIFVFLIVLVASSALGILIISSINFILSGFSWLFGIS